MPSSANDLEQELLHKVAAGDEQAFAELFNQYSDLLGSVLVRFSGSKDLAQDLVQEVFLKIWMGREALAGVRNFKTYLYVVARNQAMNAIRKAINERNFYKKLENVPTGETTDAAEREMQFTLLDEAIERLPAQQKRVFLMHRRQKMKYEEIAREMGISRETVKKYLQIAVASITAYIQQRVDIWLLVTLLGIHPN